MDKRKRYEIPQFGFNAGFKVGVRITRFLNFESGLEYSSIQYLDTNNSYHYDGWWHNPSLADLYRIHTRYNYHYINVPVGLKFLIGKKKLQCVISTGLIFTGLIIRNVTTYQYQLDKPTIKNTSHEDSYRWASVNLSPYFGIGIDYHINKLLSLCIMPIAQMQCLKNINEPITEYQCMAGLNTSLLFNLSKRK